MATRLNDLPGPKGLPILGNITNIDLPKLHQQIEQWAEEYGDVFRLDLGLVKQTVVTRPSLIQAISADRPEGFIRAKKMDRILQEGGVHGVFNAEGEDWKIHRSVVAKGLDVRHQQQFFPQLVKTVGILLNKWKKDADEGNVIDIQKDFLRFTVDVTSSLAFGYEMNTLEQEGGVIQDHMEKIFPKIFYRINALIPWYKIVKTKSDKEFEQAMSEMNKLVDQFIADAWKRIEENPSLRENPSNLIEAILIASETEESIGPKEIRGNLLTLLLAGEDTTAHTLTWLVYLLITLPSIQDEIRIEVDSILKDNQLVNDYKLNNELKYIEAAALESLRFKPVAPIVLHEAIRDIEIEGVFFQKGQHILTQYRYAALKEENFSRADQFIPERWLKTSKCPIHNTDAFTPFGAGPRYCPGRNLAILEIRNVIAMLFKNFTVELVSEDSDVKEVMAFTMMASELKVRLSHRD